MLSCSKAFSILSVVLLLSIVFFFGYRVCRFPAYDCVFYVVSYLGTYTYLVCNCWYESFGNIESVCVDFLCMCSVYFVIFDFYYPI